MSILDMSVSAGILILATAILRALAINKLPQKVFVTLWGIASIRLLVPFSFSSPFGISDLWSSFQDASAINPTIAPPIFQNAGLSESNSSIGNITNASLIDPIIYVWMIGITVLSIFFLISFISSYKRLRLALPLKGNAFISEWIALHKIHRKVQVLISDRINTPVTYGLWRPKIIFPKYMDLSNRQQIEYILAHELIHIQRLDILWKVFSIAVLCIHWFNPIVWVMYILFNRDIEIACDEKVVSLFGKNNKSDYAMTLINFAEQKSENAPFCYGFGKNAIKERIISVMKFNKTSIVCMIAAVLLVAGATTLFACAPANKIESNHTEQAAGISRAELYAKYENFGMTYNEEDDRLYFNGEKVRYFYDSVSDIEYSVPDGTVYVEAIYSSSTLTGLKESDRAEAQDTDTSFTEPISTKDGLPKSGVEVDYSAYEKYGLTYNATDCRLYYEGKLVRYFFDTRTFLGINLGEKFEYTYDDGTVGVRAARNIWNQLSGIEVMTQEEFDRTTRQIEQQFQKLNQIESSD